MCMKRMILFLCLLILSNWGITQTSFRIPQNQQRFEQLPQGYNLNSIIFKVIENDLTNHPAYTVESDEEFFSFINRSLAGYDYEIHPYIPTAKFELLELKYKAEKKSGKKLANLSLYYEIKLAKVDDRKKLAFVNELLQYPKTQYTYFKPIMGTPPCSDINYDFQTMASPDFSDKQKYHDPAPNGLDAKYAWTQTGGKGEGIKFMDCEGDWNLDHEELAPHNIIRIYGHVTNNTIHIEHGTAAMGVAIALHDNSGIKGFAPNIEEAYASTLCTSSINCTTENYSFPQPVVSGAQYLGEGDVMLMEMQMNSSVGYIPAEIDPAVFDAIKIATAMGIVVIEASGNGSNWLDHSDFEQVYDRTFQDSEAIMVGSSYAIPAVNGSSPSMSRSDHTNYGSRIDVFAWGERVTASGYGALHNGGSTARYTDNYTGTSSASSIVGGAALCLQGYYKALTVGSTLNSAIMRDIFAATGTPSAFPVSDSIGVMPDLKAAMNYANAHASINQHFIEKNELKIYPNPANESFSVYLKGEEFTHQKQIIIYDLLGKIVSVKNIAENNLPVKIEVGNLSTGMYWLEYSSEGSSKTRKSLIIN